MTDFKTNQFQSESQNIQIKTSVDNPVVGSFLKERN